MGPRKAAASSAIAPRERGTVRASVSLRRELYLTLEALAKQKKVSTAWVIREAAEKYVADQWPLFDAKGQDA
jgi:predicted DNA-binding protein